MRQPSGLRFIEITARILSILLALAAIGICIAMGVLPRNYEMDQESSDDFNGETIPGPVIVVVIISIILNLVELTRYTCLCRGERFSRRWESGCHSGTIIAFELAMVIGLFFAVFRYVYAQESQYAVARILAYVCSPLLAINVLLVVFGCVDCCRWFGAHRKKSLKRRDNNTLQDVRRNSEHVTNNIRTWPHS